MAVTTVATDTSPARRRRRWGRLLAVLCGAGLLAGGWAGWSYWRYRAAMEEIEAEIVEGRYAIACRKLDALLSWAADPSGRLVYLLGSCELARGRNEAAGEVWARVAPGCAFSSKALESRIHLLHESGRYAAAERLASDAALDPRDDRSALLALLVPIYREQGRIDEAGRLIEDRWKYLNSSAEGSLEPAINLVREHLELTMKPMPVEAIRERLEHAAQLAPDDDRVWLGRANLAIRNGEYHEAQRWLDALPEAPTRRRLGLECSTELGHRDQSD